VKLLSISTHALLRLLGVKDNGGNAVTEEEIHAMLAEGTTAGVIESHEHAMVRNVFRLDDRQIGSLMVPRATSWRSTSNCRSRSTWRASRPATTRASRWCRGGWTAAGRGQRPAVAVARHARRRARAARPAAGAAAVRARDLTGMELLDNFRESHVQMAFVIDEYGEVQGLVTLQDLVEAITGEFRPRDPQTSWAVQRDDGSWLLDGHIPVPELKDRLAAGGRARRRPRPLPDAQRHDDAADRAPAQGGRR
jgi:putative hemolysin